MYEIGIESYSLTVEDPTRVRSSCAHVGGGPTIGFNRDVRFYYNACRLRHWNSLLSLSPYNGEVVETEKGVYRSYLLIVIHSELVSLQEVRNREFRRS